jgi:hypothetical protein
MRKAPSRLTLAVGTGRRHTIYIPTALVDDKSFPFHPHQPVEVAIVGKTLVIRGA